MDDYDAGDQSREPAGCLDWFLGGFFLGSLFAIARNPGGVLACGCLALLAIVLMVAIAVYIAVEYLLPLVLLGIFAIVIVWALRSRYGR